MCVISSSIGVTSNDDEWMTGQARYVSLVVACGASKLYKVPPFEVV